MIDKLVIQKKRFEKIWSFFKKNPDKIDSFKTGFLIEKKVSFDDSNIGVAMSMAQVKVLKEIEEIQKYGMESKGFKTIRRSCKICRDSGWSELFYDRKEKLNIVRRCECMGGPEKLIQQLNDQGEWRLANRIKIFEDFYNTPDGRVRYLKYDEPPEDMEPYKPSPKAEYKARMISAILKGSLSDKEKKAFIAECKEDAAEEERVIMKKTANKPQEQLN